MALTLWTMPTGASERELGHHPQVRRPVLIASCMLLFACGEPQADESSEVSGDVEAIEWSPCPVHTGTEGGGASCARVEVPLDWADAGGRSIELFVKRIGPASGERAVWMLAGGPGAGGNTLESIALTLTAADPELVAYLPDHRGTGRSARLGCPTQEQADSPGGAGVLDEEWPGCVAELVEAWGADLAAFSTTQAAEDLAWLIDLSAEPEQAVYTYGSSYGSYLAHRHLQLHEEQLDGLVMLGAVPAGYDFGGFDARFDAVGTAFLERCSEDSVCATKLGPDADARAAQIMDMVAQGHCAESGFDHASLQTFLGTQLMLNWAGRVLAPAILYRLERCEPADVAALQHAVGLIIAALATIVEDPYYSRALGHHIKLSELWKAPHPSLAETEALVAGAVFSVASTLELLELEAIWPSYPIEPWEEVFATSELPMLMINGELDPATPLDEAAILAEVFSAPNQRWIEMPWATHTSESPTTAGDSCSLRMVGDFLRAPREAPEDCRAELIELDFGGSGELAQLVFGTDDIWD